MGALKVLSPAVNDVSAAASNVTRIQAFIDAGGGELQGTGDIYINDTLWVGDNEVLRNGVGNRLRLAPASNKLMLGTKALDADWSPVTVGWTAGKMAAVTWTAHDLIVGDWIVVQGANEADWWDILQVVAVTDADTVTVALPFLPTAAPTGTITAKRCHRNLKVDVELFYDYDNNPSAPSGYDRHAAILAFVADSEAVVRGSEVYKYTCMVAGAANLRVDAIGLGTANSDTLKVYGPCRAVEAYATGAGTEDCVTSQALEPAAYIAYMPCKGNIRGLTFDGPVATTNGAGSGAGVIYADDTYISESVVIEGGTFCGRGTNVPAFQIRPGEDFASGASGSTKRIRDVTVRGGSFNAGASQVFGVSASLRSLLLDAPRFYAPDADSYNCLRINAGQHDEIIVDGVQFDTATWAATTAYFASLVSGVTVRSLIFRNCTWRAGTALRVLNIPSGATIENLIFDGCEAENFNALVRVDGSLNTVTVRGGRYKGASASNVVNARTSCKVILDGAYFENLPNGVVRAENSGTVVTLHERGCTFAGTAVPVVCLTSAVVNPKAPSLSLDIGATGINKAAGNMCFNTGARGTIPANVPVVCDGTNWFNATNLSQTF
jgi:hypothetical protein